MSRNRRKSRTKLRAARKSPPTPAEPIEILFKRDLLRRWRISAVTFWRRRRNNTIPRHDRLCAGKPGWTRALIERTEIDGAKP